jgi:hypothetical protein
MACLYIYISKWGEARVGVSGANALHAAKHGCFFEKGIANWSNSVVGFCRPAQQRKQSILSGVLK